MSIRPPVLRRRLAGVFLTVALVLTAGACASTQPPSPCDGYYRISGKHLPVGMDLFRKSGGSYEYFGTVRKAEMREIGSAPGRDLHYYVVGQGWHGWYRAGTVGGWVRCPE